MPKKHLVSKALIPARFVVPVLAALVLVVGLVTSLILSATNQDQRSDASIQAPPPSDVVCYQMSGSSCTQRSYSGSCPSGWTRGGCPVGCTNWDTCHDSTGTQCQANARQGIRSRTCNGIIETQYCTIAGCPAGGPKQIACCLNNRDITCTDNGKGCADCPGWNTTIMTTPGACVRPRPEDWRCIRPGQLDPTVPFDNTTCDVVYVGGKYIGRVFSCAHPSNAAPFYSIPTDQLCGISCPSGSSQVIGTTTWDRQTICKGTYTGPKLQICCVGGVQVYLEKCPATTDLRCSSWTKR